MSCPCYPPPFHSTPCSAVSHRLFPCLTISRLKHTSPGGSACEQTLPCLALSGGSPLSLAVLNPHKRSCVFKSQIPLDDTSCTTGYWFAGPSAPSRVFPLHQRDWGSTTWALPFTPSAWSQVLTPDHLSTIQAAFFMTEIRCLYLKHTESRFSKTHNNFNFMIVNIFLFDQASNLGRSID